MLDFVKGKSHAFFDVFSLSIPLSNEIASLINKFVLLCLFSLLMFVSVIYSPSTLECRLALFTLTFFSPCVFCQYLIYTHPLFSECCAVVASPSSVTLHHCA